MRVITKQSSSDRITAIFRRLQILKINDLYKLETAKFIHQFSDKSLRASSEKYFTPTTFVRFHSTRTSDHNDYFLPTVFFFIWFTTFDKIFWSNNKEFDPVKKHQYI